MVDARRRDHMSRHVDLMAGAAWRDPDCVEEWIAELRGVERERREAERPELEDERAPLHPMRVWEAIRAAQPR